MNKSFKRNKIVCTIIAFAIYIKRIGSSEIIFLLHTNNGNLNVLYFQCTGQSVNDATKILKMFLNSSQNLLERDIFKSNV